MMQTVKFLSNDAQTRPRRKEVPGRAAARSPDRPVVCKKGETYMNRIYKVVWNAARQSYMVGSEFVRSTRTTGGVRKK